MVWLDGGSGTTQTQSGIHRVTEGGYTWLEDQYGVVPGTYGRVDDGGSGGAGRAPVFGPSGGASVVSIDPVGYGYVRVNYNDGSSEVVDDQSPTAQQAQTYLSGDVPAGYQAQRDDQGNVVNWVSDRSYSAPEDVRRYDQDYGEGVRRFDVGQGNWQSEFSEGVRRFDIGQGNYQQDFGEDVRRWDTNRQDMLMQYDSDLNERIALRQQRLVEIDKQEAGATGRTAMTLAAERENVAARLANDMAIAQMDNGTRLRVAEMESATQRRGQDVSQRGQDVEAGIATRGQDITREGNILGARQGQLSFAAQTDPIRQAVTLVGGSGGQTPFELAAEDFRRSIPAMPTVGAYSAPARVAGGAQVVSDRDTIMMGEGRKGEGVAMGTSELMVPMPNGDKRIMPQVKPGLELYRDPVTGKLHMANGRRMADGGTVLPPIPPEFAQLGLGTWQQVRDAWSASWANPGTSPNWQDMKRFLPPGMKLLGDRFIIARLANLARQERQGGQAQQPVAPPETPATPAGPTITPEDTLLPSGGNYMTEDAIEAARKVVSDMLRGIVGGTAQPKSDLSLDPVYGVNLGNPQDFAYSLPKMERPSRELLTSAFDLRGVAPDVFERRRREYVPATSDFRTAWG